MPVERRPQAFKTCPFPGCDWRLITAEFVGNPYTVVPVDAKTQERRVTAHMVGVHGMKTAPRIFT